MLISVASERSKRTRSIGNYLNDLNKRVSTIDKTANGNGTGSVSTDSIATQSVTAEAISDQTITIDKLDSSSLPPSANPQRIPTPLKNVDYWSKVQVDGVKTHVDAYFGDYGAQNIEATADGIVFSPERADPVAITSYELSASGVVTLSTNVDHGYEIGDSVTIHQLGSPFDGHWDIVEVPTTTSLAYSIVNFYQAKISYKAGLETGGTVGYGDGVVGVTSNAVYYAITSKSCIDGVATFTLDNNLEEDYSAGHGLEVGYVIDVFGAGSPYDGIHEIIEVPEEEFSTIKFSIIGSTVENTETAFPLTFASSDGQGSVRYKFERGTVSNYDAIANEPIYIYGFTPTTDFNLTGTIDKAFSESEFSVISDAADPDGTTSTGGMAITTFLKVDAEARLFLTGKNPVPDSRSISLSWSSDLPIDVYVAYWNKNQVGGENLPKIVKIDDTYSAEVSRVFLRDSYFGTEPIPENFYNPDREISKLQGAYSYFWEIPLSADSYTVFAEVLPGKDPVLLKEFYVFENVGDIGHKIEHIVSISLSNSVATIQTATTHPYQVGDRVTLFNVGLVDPALEDIFTVESVDTLSQSFTVNAYGVVTRTDTLDADSNVAPVYLSATAIGGPEKHQSSTVSPSGFTITGSDGSQSVTLTEDKNDNYLAIYNANSVSVASISNTGDGVFSNVDATVISADSIATDGTVTSANLVSSTATITDLTTSNASIYRLSTYGVTANNITVSSGLTAPDVYSSSANTYIVGTFANATYSNNTAYTGSYLDRLARGVVYQSYWNIPTINVPTGTTYFGLAYGTMNLEEDRAYQIFVDTSGIKYSPNTNVNLDLLMSDQPIALGAPDILIRMSQSLRANAAAYTILNQNFADMSGYFQTKPKTGSTFTNSVTTNLTSATISSWSKGTGSPVVSVTLSNSTPLTYYLKTGDYVAISNIVSVNASESLLYNGTFQITKTSGNTFTYTSGSSALSTSNSAGTVALVEPQMVNTNASFTEFTIAVATPNTVTYPMRNYFVPGQKVNVSGFSGGNTNFNVSDAFVTAANAVSFTVSSTAVGSNTSACVNATVLWTSNQLQVNKTLLPSKTPLYWILRLRHDTSTTANVALTTIGNPQGAVIVTDLGQAKTLSYAAPNIASGTEWTSAYAFPPGLLSGSGTYTPPASNANTVTTVTTYTGTLTINATASAYYDGYGKGDGGTTDPYANQQSLYQGNPGTASGTKKSIVVFSPISWTNAGVPSENRTVTKVEVYLRNRHSYYSTGLTTKIGVHGYTSNTAVTYSSLPTSIPTTSVGSYVPTTTTFTKGQGKWVTLSSTVNSFALSQGLRGIVISLTDNSPITYDSTLANYGYFDGDLQTDPPRLRITYSYTVTTTT